MKRVVMAFLVIFTGMRLSAYAAEPSIDFLAQGAVRLISVSDAWLDKKKLSALWGPNQTSSLTLTLDPGFPLDLVFVSQQKVVAPEAFEIFFDLKSPGNKNTMKVEFLVSTLSAKTGFQTIREETLLYNQKNQSIRFDPVAARWMMLRFKASGKNQVISLAGLEIKGRVGAPKSHYAFKESPASALVVIRQLKKNSSVFDISPDEASLFADAKNGKLAAWSQAEAILVASGVQEKQRRARYLAQIDQLVAEAKIMIRKGKTVYQQGELLLAWMHKRVLISGYQENQSSFSTLLDTGKFNCVSSSALYGILGQKLGLDIRAIEVPDHTFSIFYDGARHVDVETTSPAGFDPASRPEVLAQFTRQTGFNYISEKDQDKRREVTGLGLAALIYYNHGVELAKKRKYQEALLANFCALSLDAKMKTAVHNVLAVLANWSKELVGQKHYTQAVEVVEMGLGLAPKDATLLNNQKVIWEEQITAAVDAKKPTEAMQLLEIAAARMPEGNYERLQSWVFIKPSMAFIERNQWRRALALTDLENEALSPAARKKLREWKQEVYLEWSNKVLKKRDFAQAMMILGEAMKFAPQDKRYANNRGFIVFSWAMSLKKKQGAVQAEAKLKEQMQKYPDEIGIQRAGQAYVRELLLAVQLKKDGQLRAAEIIRRCEPLIRDVPGMAIQLRNAYDIQAQHHLQKKAWTQAIATYQAALGLFPDDENLHHNYRVVWENWIRQLMISQHWEKAQAVCEKAIQEKLDANYFGQRLADVVQVMIEDVYARQGPEAAEKQLRILMEKYHQNNFVQNTGDAIILNRLQKSVKSEQIDTASARNRDFIGTEKGIVDLDNRGKTLARQGKWKEALAVYQQALTLYPADEMLGNNQVAVWDRWINQAIEIRAWQQALDRCHQALSAVKAKNHFENKRVFIVQEYVKGRLVKPTAESLDKALKGIKEHVSNNETVRKMIAGLWGQKIQTMALTSFVEAERQALIIIESYKKNLGTDENIQKFFRLAYDRLAAASGSRGNWQFAVEAYTRAMQVYPEDGHLEENLIAAWNNWAGGFVQKQQWQQAIEVYEQALLVFPNTRIFMNNKEVCEQELKKRVQPQK